MTVATASATTLHRIREIYTQPLPDLMFEAQRIHREHHDPRAIQLCTLGNIKSGACPEDCGYCSQSVHNNSGLSPEPLMQKAAVLQEAQAADGWVILDGDWGGQKAVTFGKETAKRQ